MSQDTDALNTDVIDELVRDWAKERPELDASSMNVVGRLLRLGQLLSVSATEALKAHGLAYTDFDILATLRRKGHPYSLTPTELRASVLLTSGAMTNALDRLERIGFVVRTASAVDRRSRLITLTKQGRQLIDAAVIDRFQEADGWVSAMSGAQRQQLIDLLRLLGKQE